MLEFNFIDYIKRVSQRPQAGLIACTYGEFVAFICGLDAAGEPSELEGFREWLCIKRGRLSGFAWCKLALVMWDIDLPSYVTGSKELHLKAIQGLTELILEFYNDETKKMAIQSYNKWQIEFHKGKIHLPEEKVFKFNFVDYIKKASKHVGIFLAESTYGEFVALIKGIEVGSELIKLDRFQEWLCKKQGQNSDEVWSKLALIIMDIDLPSYVSGSKELHLKAIQGLTELILEFYPEKNKI